MVASHGRGWAALVVVVLASFVAAAPAWAQGAKPVSAPGDDLGFIGVPEFTSTETGILFFYEEDARYADFIMVKMRDAAEKCDRKSYEGWIQDLNRALVYYNYKIRDAQQKAAARLTQDQANLQVVANRRPPFPDNCTPPKYGTTRHGYFELAAVGGTMVPLNSSGAITGVDTFFGPGSFLIDNRTNGASSTAVPLLGARARATWQGQTVDPSSRPYVTDYWEKIGVWVETGVQTSFGAQSFIQPFGGVSTTPQGFGSNTVLENFQVPILTGVGLPITSAGPTPIVLDLYGGITLDSWTQTLQGREVGAPGGPGFFGQSRRFTVNPTIGVGVRVPMGDIGFGLPVVFGVNAEMQFRPGSVVTAPSATFPSQTYYGTVNPTANMIIMGRIAIQFGRRYALP
jgi:hypothetical protein